MSERIDRGLVLAALRDAVGRRVPNAGLIHHSDRGSQYASADYQDALKDRGFVCSMSRKGDCWDNAVAERPASSSLDPWPARALVLLPFDGCRQARVRHVSRARAALGRSRPPLRLFG